MRRSFLVAAFIATVAFGLSAQSGLVKTDKLPTIDGSVQSGEYQYSGTVSGMKLFATLGADDTLYLAIEAPTAGWVGMGVGGSIMNGSRLFLGSTQDGKPAFIEKMGRGHFYVDATDLVVKKWAVKTAGTDTIMELSLPSSAALWKGKINMILAYSRSPSFDSRHSARASLSLTAN